MVSPKTNDMSSKRTWLIYMIVFLVSFAVLGLTPLKTQFVYKEIAESHNATQKSATSCPSNATSKVDVLVSKLASRWTLLLNVCLLVPSSILGIILTAWSDKVGRKIVMTIPIVGVILSFICFALVVLFKWPLSVLIISNLIAGLTGYYSSTLVQGNAYLSDIVEVENRGKRFVILETFIGIGGGLGSFLGGIWLKVGGFFQPTICFIVLNAIAGILVIFLPNSRKIRDENNKRKEEEDRFSASSPKKPTFEDILNGNDVQIRERSPLMEGDSYAAKYGSCGDVNKKGLRPQTTKKKYTFVDLVKAVRRVYASEYSHCEKCHGAKDDGKKRFADRCCHGGGLYPGRVWRLWLYLISDDIFIFVFVGVFEFQTIYNLSPPLCFSSELIGAQLGLKFFLMATAPFLVTIYQRVLHMPNNAIIVVSFVGFISSTTVMSFAKTPALAFVATFIMLLGNPAKPFILAQMSSLVSQDEQGSLYALVSFSEIISSLMASFAFLTIYPATVQIYFGFTWLFATAALLVPLALITIIMVSDLKRQRQLDGDKQPIIT